MSDMSLPPFSLVPDGADAAAPGMAAPHAGAGGAFSWPVPPDPTYPDAATLAAAEPCELEGPNGKVSLGQLLALDAVAGTAHIQVVGARNALALRFHQFRRLTLLKPLRPRPLDPDKTTPLLPLRGLATSRLSFRDGPTIRIDSVGHVELPIGVFTFRPVDPEGAVERSFFPRARLTRIQLGDRRTDNAHIDLGDEPLMPAEAPRLADDGEIHLTLAPLAPPEPAPRASATGRPRTTPTPAPAAALVARGNARTAASAPLPAVPAAPSPPAPAAEPTATRPAPASRLAPDSLLAGDAPAGRERGDLLGEQLLTTAEQLMAAVEQQARMPMVRIGEALLALGYITEAKLGDALQAQLQDRSLPLGELLVRRGDVTRADLQTALARKMGYPIIDAAHFPVEPDAALRLPVALARRLVALPLLLRGGRLVVALEDPSARSAIDEIEFSTQLKVITELARASSLASAIEKVYAKLGQDAIQPSADLINGFGSFGDDASDTADRLLASLEQQQTPSMRDDEPQIEQSDNSLVRLINQMILEARQQGVSDIHIECQPGTEKVRVRFRRDGVLRPYIELPHTSATRWWHG